MSAELCNQDFFYQEATSYARKLLGRLVIRGRINKEEKQRKRREEETVAGWEQT